MADAGVRKRSGAMSCVALMVLLAAPGCGSLGPRTAEVDQASYAVALSEALSNAILRGNLEDPKKTVRIHARVDSSALVVDVVDEGDGFDLEACMVDPTTPDRVYSEDGRGLFLMHKLMDRVEQFPRSRERGGAGNVVRLTLRRVS